MKRQFTCLVAIVLFLSGCQLTVEVPTDFDDCVKLGGNIMESYPRQCEHNGQVFVEQIEIPVEDIDNVSDNEVLLPDREPKPVEKPVVDGDMNSDVSDAVIDDDGKDAVDDSAGEVGLANPASTFCIENGNKLEMREGKGGTYGVCVLADFTECEEWAYFRGECGGDEGVVSGGADVIDNESVCVDNCGDDVCAEIVCMAVGCSCAESVESCPQDCKES